MVLSEIISVRDVVYLILLAIFPLVVLGISILKPRGMYYITLGFAIFSLIALFSGYYRAIGIYILVYIGFSIFWAVKGGKEYEACGHKFDIYRNLYASYYADDLNDDGIIDAFDNWKIAHDPRFAWIFASRKVRMERKSKGYYNFSFGANSQEAFMRKDRWSDDSWNSGFGGSGSYGTSGQRSSSTSGQSRSGASTGRSRSNATSGQSRSKYTDQFYKRSGGASAGNRDYGPRGKAYYENSSSGSTSYGNSSTNGGAGTGNYGRSTNNMSEEEQRVARQHAFAREHNLRYFAMCTSKDEGKKLYHKYAAKFHPDNTVTGNKDKFVAIDEEYNRFCEIPDYEFVA